MDDNYQNYINRVVPTILPQALLHQLKNICKSAKFEGKIPVSFPGYTIMTPPWKDDQKNNEFYEQLKLLQEQLLEKLPTDFLIPVPPESFHLTIADLIWDNDYRAALNKNPNFSTELVDSINESFQEFKLEYSTVHPLKCKLLGLTIFPRALVVSLVPEKEFTYNQVISLRRCLYQNSHLIGLGIEQQYNFSAHITLGYFSDIPNNLEPDYLVSIFDDFNQQWVDQESPTLTINRVELRHFKDMISYNLADNYPVITWG